MPWLNGLALLGLGDGSLLALATRPKAAAKLLVVSALTANGIALRTLAFPRLCNLEVHDTSGLMLPVALGAIGTALLVVAPRLNRARSPMC